MLLSFIHKTVVIIGCITLSACTIFSVTNSSEPKKITILHTNDNHGRFWQNEDGEYGMAARKTLIDKLRAQAQLNGSEVLLLSGGDINTGIPESDMQHAEPDFKGMSLLGYDAMAIGNHEFDNPLSVLKKQQKWSNFPFLSANIFDKTTGKQAFQGYKVFNKNGLKIAVIGLTTTDTAKIGNPEYISHLEFLEPKNVTQNLVKKLKATERPDVIIAVTHMGHYSNAKHGINAPGDVSLARSLNTGTLDMIIGGHSQEPACMASDNIYKSDFKPGDKCTPDRQNGTWIVQAHEWGKYVGKAEFEYTEGNLVLTDYKLIPVNYKKTVILDGKKSKILTQAKIENDPAIYSFLKQYQEKGQAKLSASIAKLKGDLDGERNHVRFHQTNLGRLIAAAQMEKVNADFGVISGGGIRNSIQGGDVNYKDVLTVHPFKNRLTYVEMKGDEIQSFLTTVASFPSDAGAYTQFYGVSLTLKDGKASNIKIKNKALIRNKIYRFSINSYNAAGGDGYPKLNQHPSYVATNYIDAEVLKEYLMKHSPIDAAAYLPQNEITYL
ncbi:bifunctional UDP-sugar hydrolase/5'-nucleotidase UshA [Pseudoalteromonas denitrificans]|uniref:5'-nucleotidase / UDP-sugar diphosphatase n=1 Tax=Pseudoalteromonas denitrificans DSM 6059 TaxID=1123010 RepID=A0A1I1FKI8_9GAMM|nr:bifunctional UDP-sugar hydrolase/5'-nucleotidase UshA [Pseudoalteromonas denitrificans]SFB99937.1 5'-nucleotidase / UDP-sugar diphosphatase [Pseudoalteromonas denitrificans DSM 6059]